MGRMVTLAYMIWLEALRRKDAYVLLVLLGGLLTAVVSLNVFGLGGVVRYVLDVGLLAAWVLSWVMAVVFSSRQLPQEETRGTIYSLLAKPITRAEIVVGKWLGSWIVVSLVTALFYLLVTVVVLLKGGSVPPGVLVQAYLLHVLALAVLTSIGTALSTRLHADAAASLGFVLTGISFAVVPRIPEFMARETGPINTLWLCLYNTLPHFEVFDMRQRVVHAFGPLDGGSFLAVAAYGVVATSIFLLLAWIGYRHKRFSRESIA